MDFNIISKHRKLFYTNLRLAIVIFAMLFGHYGAT